MLTMSTPAISVVMPVYNGERYLRDAVASILQQTFRDFEFIAVNDGSKDRSKAILDDIASVDPRLRVVSQANTGIVGALNHGLAIAKGEFVARMDADDFSQPERFAQQITFLRQNPNCVCVGTAFNYMDSRSALIKWNPRETDHTVLEKQLLTGDGGSLIHPTIMLRRSAVVRAGGYRSEAQWVEDLDLYLRLAQIGQLANLPDVLLNYRYHTESVNFTRNEGRHLRKLWVMEQAYVARNLPFDPTQWPAPPVNPSIGADDAREFALTSLRFPRRSTPWRYALRAARLAPGDPRSWQVLKYVMITELGFAPRIR